MVYGGTDGRSKLHAKTEASPPWPSEEYRIPGQFNTIVWALYYPSPSFGATTDLHHLHCQSMIPLGLNPTPPDIFSLAPSNPPPAPCKTNSPLPHRQVCKTREPAAIDWRASMCPSPNSPRRNITPIKVSVLLHSSDRLHTMSPAHCNLSTAFNIYERVGEIDVYVWDPFTYCNN
jgi:hypothetical protein